MRGSSAIEFALIAPIFFLLLCGVIDFGRLFFVQMTMQDALRQAARYASTGQHLGGTDQNNQPYTRETSIQQIIFDEAAAAGISSASVTVAVSSAQGGILTPAGNPLDTVTIQVTVTMNLLTGYIAHFFVPNGQYVFTPSIRYKNEAFSPRCTTAPYTGC